MIPEHPVRPSALRDCAFVFSHERTNLGGMQDGTVVNLEVDVLAKYVEKLTVKGSR